MNKSSTAVVRGVNDVIVVVSNATRIIETRQKVSDERGAYGRLRRRRPPSGEVDGPSTRPAADNQAPAAAVFRRLASGKRPAGSSGNYAPLLGGTDWQKWITDRTRTGTDGPTPNKRDMSG